MSNEEMNDMLEDIPTEDTLKIELGSIDLVDNDDAMQAAIADKLSDKYGFCSTSFEYETICSYMIADIAVCEVKVTNIDWDFEDEFNG